MSIEERLARDIESVTRGVVVSDQDLREAHRAIHDRIASGRQRQHRTVLAAAAAVVLVVVLGVAALLTLDAEDTAAPPANGGPTPQPSAAADRHATFLSGRAPSDEDLRAVWRLDNGFVLMRFAAPDLVSLDRGGRLFDNPGVQGRYTLEGDTIRIAVDGGPNGCGGARIRMRASVPADGRLHLAVTEQGEGACAGLVDSQLVMERMLPLAGYEDYLAAGERGWLPVTDSRTLIGTYFAEGGGYLLELDRGNQYHVASGTGEQVDYGEWALERGKLTLTSWPDSVQCSSQDRLVMGNLEFTRPHTTMIRFDVARNDCGGTWTPKSWILIPYEGS
ncbi:MAG TPA: hypothetical protein VFR56_00550 [Actinomycetes bacterium]|nr:hypothetical protein [Actinomycetes bacterium]